MNDNADIEMDEIAGVTPANFTVEVTAPHGLNVRLRPNLDPDNAPVNSLMPGASKNIKGTKEHDGYLWGLIDNKDPNARRHWIALERLPRTVVIPGMPFVKRV